MNFQNKTGILSPMTALIAPSLLSADFSRLGEELKTLEKAGADRIHWDIMDSYFVPSLSFGPMLLKALRPLSRLPFDAHLMVSRPEALIEPLVEAGANSISFHIEAEKKPKKLLQKIQSFGLKAGLALKPATALDEFLPWLEFSDLLLVMTVEPGKSGQSFLKEQVQKVKLLRQHLKELDPTPLIAVDGGIRPETALYLKQEVDILISGDYILKSKDYAKSIASLKNLKLT